MTPFRYAPLVLAVAVVPAWAADQIPAAVLDRLKAATVFVRVQAGTATETASGFLVKGEGDRYFVVTTWPAVASDAGRGDRPPAGPTVDVVVRSGQAGERTVRADVVAGHPLSFLALLKLRDPRDLPEPLDHSLALNFVETLPICVLGFPFGGDLPGAGRNPAVTISRGTVSSIREARGRKLIQVDAAIGPGQSGGPIVDAQGRLIGVAAVGIDGTKIGFALPVAEIAPLFAPRVARLALAVEKPVGGEARVRCTVDAADPLGRIRTVGVRYAAAGGRRPLPKAAGDATHPELPDAKPVELSLKDGKATGEFRVATSDAAPAECLVQIVVTYADQSVGRSEPQAVTLQPMQVATVPRASWLRGLVGAASLVERSVAAPRPGTPVLAGEWRVELPPPEPRRRHVTNPYPFCWSTDGKWLYTLGPDGTVRKLSCPGLREEAAYRTDLKAVSSIVSTAAGLVVAGAGEAAGQGGSPGRVVVVDAETLKPVRTITDVKHPFERVVSSSTSRFAYAKTATNAPDLVVIDLTKGDVVKAYKPDDFAFPEPSLSPMVASPDGKWLVTRDNTRLYRFRLDGADVRFEESSPKLLQWNMPEEPAISYDGSWVRATCDNRQEGRTADGRFGTSTHLFAMTSLSKAAQALHGVRYPQCAEFDHQNGYVYVNSDGQVDVFDVRGNYVVGHRLDTLLQAPFSRIAVHPSGRYVACFVFEAKGAFLRVVLVELPAVPAPRAG